MLLMKNSKSVKGTTLVEVILSVALLSIIFIPFLGSILSSVQNNVTSKERTEAVAMAEKVIYEIKSRSALASTIGEQPYIMTGSSIFVPYYTIQEVSSGNVTPAAINTYNPAIGNDSDFELIIDQGASDDSIINSIEFSNYGMVGASRQQIGSKYTFSNVSSTSEPFVLSLDYNSGFRYSFGKSTEATIYNAFIPIDANNIKLTVKYINGSLPKKQMNIFVKDLNSYYNDKFNIYVMNDEQSNSGVNFLNRSDIDFNVNYYDTGTYTGAALNSLFKITANIKKNGSVVYSQTTLVKK